MRPVFLADWLEAAERRQVPVWFRAKDDLDFAYLADILLCYPRLPVVTSFLDEWPNNRKTYPLLTAYPNVYLCLSDLIWMGGVEDFVGRFGSRRLLFSTNYPVKYPGAAMLMLKNADITEKDKENIACVNLERMMGGICRD